MSLFKPIRCRISGAYLTNPTYRDFKTIMSEWILGTSGNMLLLVVAVDCPTLTLGELHAERAAPGVAKNQCAPFPSGKTGLRTFSLLFADFLFPPSRNDWRPNLFILVSSDGRRVVGVDGGREEKGRGRGRRWLVDQ